jgi:hypothetical protein
MKKESITRVAPVKRAWPSKEMFEAMKEFRERHVLPKGETTKDLVDGGRRM